MRSNKAVLIHDDGVDLERLGTMRHRELLELYRKVFHRNAPAGQSEYARRRIAWQSQASTEGGLPESARQHALAIARNAKLRTRVRENVARRDRGLSPDQAAITCVVGDHDSRLPMPGSVLVKQHRGRTIVVRVLDCGFEYDNRRFASLSAIAHEITGTKWNGFLFFGLAKGGTRGR